MPTKGPSNHFGNAKHGRQGKRTQHTGFAWAKGFNSKTLSDHFSRHGEQMGCQTKEAYEAHAVKFANTVDRKNCVSFVDKNGSTNILLQLLISTTERLTPMPSSAGMVMSSHTLSQQKVMTTISGKRRGG